MTQNYKSDEWLRQKLDEKCTVQQMAYLCQVSIGTIQDHLRKNKLQPAIEMPNDLRDVDVLQLCGKQRRPIPQDVIRATTPKDNATVAIIGGNGFVGKNLTTYFKHNTNYNVISYSRMDCDAMDRPALQKKLDCIRPEVVINLAAFVGGIGLNRDNPADMIYRNLMISSNVIDACYTVGIRKLVTMGSVCSYPHTPPHIPFVEDDLWHDRPEPTNEPYGVAKKTTGLMLEAYKRQFNFCSTYLIPTNMYGPHDDFSLHGSQGDNE
jgi:FlaA1/EpsC-like NDP-sugar epimerase